MKQMVIVYHLAKLLSGEDGVYLGQKLSGVGEGTLMSGGGKPEGNETLIEAAMRETKEEWGVRLRAEDLRPVALLHISREGVHEFDLTVYVTRKWEGEFVASKEIGVPTLFAYSKVPYNQMMPADTLWLRAVLSGLTVEAEFTYDRDRKEVLNFKMHPKTFV